VYNSDIYILTSSANALTTMPYVSNKAISSLIYDKNIIGPIPLPCIMPLDRSARSDKEESTLVC